VFSLGAFVQAVLDPALDLGAREAPLAVDAPARQVPPARQLVHLARVAGEVGGRLIEVEVFHRVSSCTSGFLA
jgi:hypothetical protein